MVSHQQNEAIAAGEASSTASEGDSLRTQWSLKEMLLITTLVAVQLALFRMGLPFWTLTSVYLLPVFLMVITRCVLGLSDSRVARFAGIAFHCIGALIGGALGVYLVMGSPLQHTVELLGLAAFVLGAMVIGALIGGVYSILIVTGYGMLMGILSRIGVV